MEEMTRMARIKAIFFDQDGVIIDTEKDGHRVAFNEGFKAFGFDFQWSVAKYHELLQIAGGKERMRHYFKEEGLFTDKSPEDLDTFIKDLHKKKTEIFISLIESGKLPLRSGIKRFMQEGLQKGLKLGVCTTANERSANAITRGILGDIDFSFVLAGDMVKKKKPDPEIYLSGLEKIGLKPEECLVVEDSHVGIKAARSAGIRVLATTNVYTADEDLSAASIVVNRLGDPDGKKGELKKGDAGKLGYDGVLHVEQVIAYLSE
jgi:HAD superfamily hydrolase (TIGR01509 family)